MQIIPIELTLLTKENFAPYGRVLEPHTTQPTKSGEGWSCFSDIDRMTPDVPLMVGLVYCGKMPERISSLEGHTSREELLWATDKDLIMVVSEPEEIDNKERKPSIAKTKAFLIKKGEAVIIGKGTWHSPAFSADGEEAKYFFLVEAKADSVDQDSAPWICFDDGNEIMVI